LQTKEKSKTTDGAIQGGHELVKRDGPVKAAHRFESQPEDGLVNGETSLF